MQSQAQICPMLAQFHIVNCEPASPGLRLPKFDQVHIMKHEWGCTARANYNAALSQDKALVRFFEDTSILPEEVNDILEERGSSPMKQSDKMFKVFSRPQIHLEDMKSFKKVAAYIDEHNLEKDVLEQAEIKVKYAGYIAKEKLNADKLSRLENIKIPDNFDYTKLKSLSYEACEKLSKIRPRTISQASRVSGVSPSDISVMLVYMGR